MSAFRDLLKQAHERGVRHMTFAVNLDRFFATNEDDESWYCEAPAFRRCDGFGRTGEEALRVVVALIEEQR
jgi:hypothetical protein